MRGRWDSIAVAVSGEDVLDLLPATPFSRGKMPGPECIVVTNRAFRALGPLSLCSPVRLQRVEKRTHLCKRFSQVNYLVFQRLFLPEQGPSIIILLTLAPALLPLLLHESRPVLPLHATPCLLALCL